MQDEGKTYALDKQNSILTENFMFNILMLMKRRQNTETDNECLCVLFEFAASIKQAVLPLICFNCNL